MSSALNSFLTERVDNSGVRRVVCEITLDEAAEVSELCTTVSIAMKTTYGNIIPQQTTQHYCLLTHSLDPHVDCPS